MIMREIRHGTGKQEVRVIQEGQKHDIEIAKTRMNEGTKEQMKERASLPQTPPHLSSSQ